MIRVLSAFARLRFALLVVLAASCIVARTRAAEQIATTDEVKAAFLFNFAKFVEWPSDAPAAGPLTIGIVGSDGIFDALRELVRGESIGPKSIAIRRIGAGDDLASMHVLFVGQSERTKVLDSLQRVDKAPILTVSDVEGFCEQGGVIALTLEGNHVRFEISLDAAERGRLKVSSKLLALARKVHPITPASSGSR